MSKLTFGGPGEIPLAKETCDGDRFDNMIRRFGVQFACEWFGHNYDSDFTRETIRVLIERSEENPA